MEVDDCLCGIGNCEDDLRPYLQTWQRENRAASLNHLSDFIGYNARHLLKEKRLDNAFWEEREPQARQAIEWLLDPAITKKLENRLSSIARTQRWPRNSRLPRTN